MSPNQEWNPEETEEEKEPFVPSPVSRRIWAWMGVVYTLIVMLLITYWIATTTFLHGITGILLFPVLGALSAQGINNWFLCKKGEHPGNPITVLGSAILMGLLSIGTLLWGAVQLIAALGG